MANSRLAKLERRKKELDRRAKTELASCSRLARTDPKLLNGLSDFMKRSPVEEEVSSEASGSGPE